jgi:hypothetical protein
MIVSNELDGATSEELAKKLSMLVGKVDKDADLTHREILCAYMFAMGNVLALISCRDCREKAAQFIKSALPHLVGHALDRAGEHHGDQLPISGHVH